MYSPLKSFLRFPTALESEVKALREKLAAYEVGWPPGHFYSPIPSLAEVRAREDRIWTEDTIIPGVDLREPQQLALLETLAQHYQVQPWSEEKQSGLRYHFDNPNFRHGESIIMFCLLLELKPRKVLEIGSGYSSCVLLDTRERFFQEKIDATFIEPYPDLLMSLVKESDKAAITVKAQKLQEVELDVFSDLNAGDILFVDSTHVSKIDSDVNYIMFSVLPALKKGVVID